MTLNTPMGVGWPGMPVEIAPCATGTPLLNSVTRWVPIETTICCTPFFAAPNPSFSGLGFFAASLVLAALRTAASAGSLSPATRTKATLDRSAARSAMFPGRLQADIAAFLLLLRQRPRKNPPLALPGERLTETRVERESCLSPSRPSWDHRYCFCRASTAFGSQRSHNRRRRQGTFPSPQAAGLYGRAIG